MNTNRTLAIALLTLLIGAFVSAAKADPIPFGQQTVVDGYNTVVSPLVTSVPGLPTAPTANHGLFALVQATDKDGPVVLVTAHVQLEDGSRLYVNSAANTVTGWSQWSGVIIYTPQKVKQVLGLSVRIMDVRPPR